MMMIIDTLGDVMRRMDSVDSAAARSLRLRTQETD